MIELPIKARELGDRLDSASKLVSQMPRFAQLLNRKYAGDRAEYVGRCGALVVRCGWSTAAPRPAPGDICSSGQLWFIFKPDFYIAGLQTFVARDLFKARREDS